MTDDTTPWHSRGYLPHFDELGRVQLITFRLADALPQAVLQRLRDETDDAERFWCRERELDRGYGACWLRETLVAETVERCLLHGDGDSYRLLAWVVMPNHVHTLVDLPAGGAAKTVQAWKGASAHLANRLLSRKGRFWYPDYHDRFIRTAEHLERARTYVERNPVRAGLCGSAREWWWGSARRRPPLLSGRGRPDTQSGG